MKKIVNIFLYIAVASLVVTSCNEWDPVVNIGYDEPADKEAVTLKPTMTIQALKALYTEGKPVHIETEEIIGGKVISSDKSGNIYNSLYIQDETGGIEIKIGKSALYNTYHLGQWVYVKLEGLVLGAYEGMLQIGLEDPTGEYETAYMNIDFLIDRHVFRGKQEAPVTYTEISESELTADTNQGKYVILKGLTYGDQIFSLLYINPNNDKKLSSNRIFLSDQTWGVTTWAMSTNGMQKYLDSGVWDLATSGDGSKTVAQLRAENAITASAYYVSHYFTMGSTSVQVRTSGYARFADTQLDPRILNGTVKVNLIGILSNYRGAPQFTLIDLEGVQIVE